MSTETTTEEIQVISLEPVEINALYQEPENIEALIEKLSAQALAIVPDTSTAKGRGLIKSTAYAVTQMRTKAASVGKERIAELRRKYETDTEQTRATVKLIEDKLTALAKTVREPLTRWEEDQKRIAERFEQRKKDIARLGIPSDEFGLPLDLEGLEFKLNSLSKFIPETQDEEDALSAGKERIAEAIAAEKKRIAEQQELDRLRKQQEEQDRLNALLEQIASVSGLDDNGELTEPAVIQERINRLAEIKSDNPRVKTALAERKFLLEAQKKESVHQQEIKAEKQRAETFANNADKAEAWLDTEEAQQADIAKLEATKDRVNALLLPVTTEEQMMRANLLAAFDELIAKAAQRKRDAEEAARSKAFSARIETALESLQSSSLHVIEKAIESLNEIEPTIDVEFKAQDEVRKKLTDHLSAVKAKIESDRQAREKQIADEAAEKARRDAEAKLEADRKAAEEAQAKREADTKHRKAVNGEAAADIMATGMSEEQARVVVTAIATGKVRHVRIEY